MDSTHAWSRLLCLSCTFDITIYEHCLANQNSFGLIYYLHVNNSCHIFHIVNWKWARQQCQEFKIRISLLNLQLKINKRVTSMDILMSIAMLLNLWKKRCIKILIMPGNWSESIPPHLSINRIESSALPNGQRMNKFFRQICKLIIGWINNINFYIYAVNVHACWIEII